MKICLVGHFSVADEARKVMAHNLQRTLAADHEVTVFDLTRWSAVDQWRKVKLFAPDIIQYIPGASPQSFFFTRALKSGIGSQTKTVMFSALNVFQNPVYGIYYAVSHSARGLIPLIRTDLVLVQSDQAEAAYGALGCNVRFEVYSGVDLKKFYPVPPDEKEKLRAEYEIVLDKFVVLHVGSIRKWRNLEPLVGIQKEEDVQVIVVGRSTTKSDKAVAHALRKAGAVVIDGYTPKIEEFYGLADCYVFPTTAAVGAIDVPLSVLEAMAHNLPIVSTRFGGLPRIFSDEHGLLWADAADFRIRIRALKESRIQARTRELVLPYAWENIARNLASIYQELLTT
jgi:glycosyltransferase involved in cell wall biosynthesis